MKIVERSNGVINFEIIRRSGDIYTCLIDDVDEHILTSYTWHILQSKKGKTSYVRSGTTTYLHRLICEGEQIDHINQNGLDNRRCNLRAVTRSQNALNRPGNVTNKSGWKGVREGLPGKKYRGTFWVTIRKDGKQTHVGSYRCPLVAALAYDKAAKEIHGEFAYLNLPI